MVGLRVSRRWGPARIAYRLGLTVSTVHKILRRYGCPPLAWTDPATGVRIKWSRKKANTYVHDAPGDLVHVDIKKLGRIPDGGGWRVLGRQAGRTPGQRGTGYWYIHNAVDDCSRLGYSELLHDERKETAAEFWKRANAYFNTVGVTVKRVLTDNGSCYRSHAFAAALGDITHKRTPATRPQTNGKVERFQPDPAQSVGLRPALQLRVRTRRALSRVAPHLPQSPPRSHRARRQVTSRPRAQPSGQNT